MSNGGLVEAGQGVNGTVLTNQAGMGTAGYHTHWSLATGALNPSLWGHKDHILTERESALDAPSLLPHKYSQIRRLVYHFLYLTCLQCHPLPKSTSLQLATQITRRLTVTANASCIPWDILLFGCIVLMPEDNWPNVNIQYIFFQINNCHWNVRFHFQPLRAK